MNRRSVLQTLGPGLALAATGVGAGDLLAAMVAGASYGEVLAWAVVLGAVLKLALNDAIARWQLATGTTLLEGWCRHLGRPFQVYPVVYLVVWTFIVAWSLLWLGGRRELGDLRNGRWSTTALALSLLLFAALAVRQAFDLVVGSS